MSIRAKNKIKETKTKLLSAYTKSVLLCFAIVLSRQKNLQLQYYKELWSPVHLKWTVPPPMLTPPLPLQPSCHLTSKLGWSSSTPERVGNVQMLTRWLRFVQNFPNRWKTSPQSRFFQPIRSTCWQALMMCPQCHR